MHELARFGEPRTRDDARQSQSAPGSWAVVVADACGLCISQEVLDRATTSRPLTMAMIVEAVEYIGVENLAAQVLEDAFVAEKLRADDLPETADNQTYRALPPDGVPVRTIGTDSAAHRGAVVDGLQVL